MRSSAGEASREPPHVFFGCLRDVKGLSVSWFSSSTYLDVEKQVRSPSTPRWALLRSWCMGRPMTCYIRSPKETCWHVVNVDVFCSLLCHAHVAGSNICLFSLCDDWPGSQIIDNRRTCGSSIATRARTLANRPVKFQLGPGRRAWRAGKRSVLAACWHRSGRWAQRRCQRARFPMISTAALIAPWVAECPAKRGRASSLESSPAVNVMARSICQEKKNW